MDINTRRFISYWRNTLADAESGKGTFGENDIEPFSQWAEIASGRLKSEAVRGFFKNEKPSVKSVAVLVRPQVWLRTTKHGKARAAGAPAIVTPLIIPARLYREGFIVPAASATIPRDLLEPLPKGSFSIGEMAQYDSYKTTHPAKTVGNPDEDERGEETENQKERRYAGYQQQWQRSLCEAEKLLTSVAGAWVDSHEHYEAADYGLIIKARNLTGYSCHIFPLYDDLLVSNKEVPLLTRFTAQDAPRLAPLLASHTQCDARLGHSGDKFPLAVAQRDALNHYLAQRPGDILAVNGPPGTGKTTLLLSIIATEWVSAAVKQTEPPIVVATSTNNQAVTNIIEAFGKDFAPGSGAMAGRWLPEVTSYGAYYPSKNRREEAKKKYQTDDFFTDVESLEYAECARHYFLEKARAAFPGQTCDTPAQVVDYLHARLTQLVERLHQIEPAWNTLNDIRQQRCAISDDIEQYLQDKRALLLTTTNEIAQLVKCRTQWQQYRASESWVFTLLSCLPAVRNKRRYQIKVFLDTTFGSRLAAFNGKVPEGIDAWIDGLIDGAQREQEASRQRLVMVEDVLQRESEALQQWREVAAGLGYAGEGEMSLARADELADTQLRFPAFLLATHYWEGRWLMDMAAIDKLKDEEKSQRAGIVKARWQRRMKLTPCIVMTNFMLPKYMQTEEVAGNKAPHSKSYYYGLADLLIVDEAGQVLPEVAAASFALAKKALVIGDTEQLAPIWSSLPGTDIGNLLEEELLFGETQEQLVDAYSEIAASGKSAASGSVMKVAQFCSRYQYDPDLERGMYLYEHRRCFDNIIGFCNALCYRGKLQPKRGVGQETLFPALGYLHVDGKGVKAKGSGSRYNTFEADTLAAWLMAHKPQIERYYSKPLHEVVGIVTPFSAQENAIKAALHKLGIACYSGENSLTVGTVNALQGAERDIVLFSPVYSKHEDGNFIDRENSMLNVAVSRAKDSFLVIGDMDLFEIQPKTSPRGLLAHYLFASGSNALQFEFEQRPDLTLAQTEISTLHGVTEHDAFLNQTLADIGHSITIVSPWLTWKKLEQTGFLASMASARARGVDITVVTDRHYNTAHDNYEKQKEKQRCLNEALASLNEMGITTRLVNRVHSKLVIGDDALLCVGSFNWFSAARDAKVPLHDTSMVYRGAGLKSEIKTICASLAQRQLAS